MNCFVNSGTINFYFKKRSFWSYFFNIELDKRRVKHLASTIQDLLVTEMRNDDGK